MKCVLGKLFLALTILPETLTVCQCSLYGMKQQHEKCPKHCSFILIYSTGTDSIFFSYVKTVWISIYTLRESSLPCFIPRMSKNAAIVF